MERLGEGPLARLLRDRRDEFNARYERARGRFGPIESGDFARHLCVTVDRAVRAVDAACPARTAAVAEALYELTLELLGKGLLGGRAQDPAVLDAWEIFVPTVPWLLADAPRTFPARLINASHRLSRDMPALAPRWVRELLVLAGRCTKADECLAAGQVLAWRLGCAHWRDSALERWRELPVPLRYLTLGLVPEPPPVDMATLEQRLRDRWCDPRQDRAPAPSLAIVARVGGFRGFGGVFRAPPIVAESEGELFAFDDDGCFSIHADAFGATLRRSRRGLPTESSRGAAQFRLSAAGDVACGNASARLEELAGAASSAGTADLLAVTVPHSHFVYLVASR